MAQEKSAAVVDHISISAPTNDPVVQIAVLTERILSMEKALILQATTYDRRLEDLNHAAENSEKIQQNYLPREVFDKAVQTLNEIIKSRNDLCDQRFHQLEGRWERLSGGAQTAEYIGKALWALLGGLIIAGITFILTKGVST